MNFKSIVWLLPFVFSLQACLFSSGGKRQGGPDPVARGFYEFGNPASGVSLSLDSTYQVQWTASDSAGTGSVRLSVYQGDVFLGNLSTALPASGVYSWSLSASRSLGGWRLGSGSGYRLRIVNASDSSKWDFSPAFTLISRYNGAISLTAPARGAKAKVDSGLVISWSTSGEIGPYVGLQLYKDTVLARTIVTTLSATLGTYPWTAALSTLGSGDDYHIRIFASYDPSISQMGPAFRISSSWSGSFSFRYPGEDDTLTAGTVGSAAWTMTGNPGTTAQLSLWRDSAQVSPLVTAYVGTADSTTWSVSAGLTSGRYRLRLTSTSDPAIYAFSPAFYVIGADPDEYERDDSLALAKAIDTDGKPQKRNLTMQDADWMRFDAKKGKLYLVTLHSTLSVYLDVADSAGRQLKQQYGYNTQFTYAPAYTGRLFLHVFPGSSTAPGPYQVSVAEYDSSDSPFKADFTSPDEKTTWATGSTYTIAWTADSLLFGATVTLMLYNDTTFVQYIASYAANNGSYSWSLPAGLYTGSKYRIRIAAYSGSIGYAFSPYFSISGATPDTYEPDNSRGAAKAIAADGEIQQRNLTINDSDWVRFDGTAGKTYLASVNAGTASVYLYVTDSAGLLLTSQYGSRFSLSYIPVRNGKYYLRVQPYSGVGAYTLSLSMFDPAKGGLPVKFSSPDSGSVWSAGSGYTINWVPDSTVFGSQINLELYNDTVLAQSIYSYLGNTGSYSWSIPAGIYTSGKYRIRISSYTNRAVYGFSPYFTISGVVPDAYEPDNLRSAAKAISDDGAAQQRNIVSGDTDWVRFDGVAGKTYLATVNSAVASVYLYITDSTGSTLASQTGARVSATYTPTRSGKYYVRVQYYSSPGAYSLTLASFAAGQGGVPVKFTNPDSTAVWSAGSAYTAAWAPDSALFGTYVTLSLYLDAQFLYNLSSYVANSGSASVTLPYGLATGKNYRLRLTNYPNSQVYGSSQPFSIAGTAPDNLEPNDTLTAAKAIVPNSPRQALSLSYRDKDWFSFTAKAQKLYVIQTVSATALPTTLRLWPATGGSALLSATKTSLDSVNSLSWLAPADGEYLISVEASSSSSAYGAYGFELKELEPSAYKFAVSAPAADTSFLAGGTLSVKWSDPAAVKGYVDIFLYNGESVVTTIVANLSNTGAYTWTVPAGLPARSDYYVKIISRMSSAITGSSGAFSISP
jgi:Na+-transporting NADH:ubiquinone oxidoreductase subunit NqrB